MNGMQPTPPHTVERCQLLLEHWRSQLQLSPRDQGLLGVNCSCWIVSCNGCSNGACALLCLVGWGSANPA